jgi:hypothetical protein
MCFIYQIVHFNSIVAAKKWICREKFTEGDFFLPYSREAESDAAFLDDVRLLNDRKEWL